MAFLEIACDASFCAATVAANACRDFAHVLNNIGNTVDSVHSCLRLALHFLDLLGDLLGRTRRLVCQVFHLAGNDSKTLSALSRTRRLDGGVQGEQVCLVGNVVNQINHLSDSRGRYRQSLDALVSNLCLARRRLGDAVRLRHLFEHLVNRRRKLSARSGHGGDVSRRSLGRGCHLFDLLRRLLRILGEQNRRKCAIFR